MWTEFVSRRVGSQETALFSGVSAIAGVRFGGMMVFSRPGDLKGPSILLTDAFEVCLLNVALRVSAQVRLLRRVAPGDKTTVRLL